MSGLKKDIYFLNTRRLVLKETEFFSALAWMRLFNAAFNHFLINLLQIFHQRGGEGAAGPAPPLNPRLVGKYM